MTGSVPPHDPSVSPCNPPTTTRPRPARVTVLDFSGQEMARIVRSEELELGSHFSDGTVA